MLERRNITTPKCDLHVQMWLTSIQIQHTYLSKYPVAISTTVLHKYCDIFTFTACYDAKHHTFYPHRVRVSNVSQNKQLFFL